MMSNDKMKSVKNEAFLISPNHAMSSDLTDQFKANSSVIAHRSVGCSTQPGGHLADPSSSTKGASLTYTSPGGHSLTSMVNLLEEQWNQGSQFLSLQGKKYNIPSLLSSLYELQTENRQLESELSDVSSKRKQLHVMNQQLAVPLSSMNTSSSGHSSLTTPLQLATATSSTNHAPSANSQDVLSLSGSHSQLRDSSRSKAYSASMAGTNPHGSNGDLSSVYSAQNAHVS